MLSDDEQEVAKPKETIDNVQLLLEDDEMFEENENMNQAQAEDDVSEESSLNGSDGGDAGKFFSNYY